MDTRLPSSRIEAILRDHLQPYHCQCRTEMDNSLSVRLFRENGDYDELTVLGINPDECRDAEHLHRLAQQLRVELDATRATLASRPACALGGPLANES